MKNTKQKLILSQEALRILVHEKPATGAGFNASTFPWCPTCSAANGGLR